MNRVAGYLLSVYILLCAIVPCSFFDDCESDLAQEQTAAKGPYQECANCSPFSICSACQTAAGLPQQLTLAVLLNGSPYLYTSYTSFLKQGHYATLFQPPRVV